MCLSFGGSKTFFLFVCISRILYNLRNQNVVKHLLVEKRIFWGLYDFLHQHGSLIKSMCTSCKNSKSTSVEVEESGVKCRIILFQMSNYLSCISTYASKFGKGALKHFHSHLKDSRCVGNIKQTLLDYAKKNGMMELMKKRGYIRTQVVVA